MFATVERAQLIKTLMSRPFLLVAAGTAGGPVTRSLLVSCVTSAVVRGSLTARMDVSPNLYRRLVLAALFPIACPGCGALGAPVCRACAATLRPAPIAPPPPGLDAWAAPYAYAGVAREAVARVKYRN